MFTYHLKKIMCHLKEFISIFFVDIVNDVNARDKIKTKKHVE